MNQSLSILGYSLKGIYACYAKNNAFTDPEIIFKPGDDVVIMKIGMLSKDKWKIINKKRSVKEP